MAKIRTIKPDLFRHEELFEAENKYRLPLRLAFIGLFTCCDREGRFRWKPRQLKLDALPYDDVDFASVLEALRDSDFIRQYEKEGEYYGYIPSWCKHQAINTREPESKLPDPSVCTHVRAYDKAAQISPSEQSVLSKDGELSHPSSQQLAVASDLTAPRYCTTSSTCMHVQTREKHAQAHLEMEMEVEEEREMEMEMEINPVALMRPRVLADNNLMTVFSHWKTRFHHPGAILDDKRKKLIRNALKSGYSPQQLCDAITGCSLTPHNMGHNDRGQRYDGLHIILRDADQIERFISNARCPPKSITPAEKHSQANVQTLQSWLNKKITEERVIHGNT